MADADLSRYTAIIVPGAQPHNDFYPDYIRHAAKFDEFVAQGGTLILELNGAEGTSIVLPRGVTMTPNAGLENAILASNHPVFAPFGSERLFRANYREPRIPFRRSERRARSRGGIERAARLQRPADLRRIPAWQRPGDCGLPVFSRSGQFGPGTTDGDAARLRRREILGRGKLKSRTLHAIRSSPRESRP